jgi:hypothetical protein
MKLLKKGIHGTNDSYTRGYCRCEDCKEAHRIASLIYRSKNRKKYNDYMKKLRSGTSSS